jgi:hypothetical protein
MMTTSTSIDRVHRFLANIIEQAVWLSIRFPLSLRMVEVEDLLAVRGIVISHESGTKPHGVGQRHSAGLRISQIPDSHFTKSRTALSWLVVGLR